MLDALSNVPNSRMALPGEFTKRAFFSGKLDLTEVEGLADLIHSETESQRKQAVLQSTGSLSKLYKSWRQRIIRCIAHLEAYIDFAEDENIEDDVIENLKTELKSLIFEIQQHLNDQRQGELLRNGIRTAIIGAPNVGKSSFINLICQRKISIVTSIAGTTRDIIESSFNIGDYPVILADTAGLRKQTDDVIEIQGIQKALEYVENSDLIILIIDATDLIKFMNKSNEIGNCEDYMRKYLKNLGINESDLKDKIVVPIVNKIDLIEDKDISRIKSLSNIICISCKENLYVNEMLDELKNNLKQLCGQPSTEHPRLTHSRYRQQLKQCLQHLINFLDEHDPEFCSDFAIAAQKLRSAVKCIEKITGEVRSEEILDVIFRDFCIGK